jgi:hypothetical protein
MAVWICRTLVTCVRRFQSFREHADRHSTHQPGIDESKIKRFTFRISLVTFQVARAHNACPQFRRV